jgi:hypothetical protein
MLMQVALVSAPAVPSAGLTPPGDVHDRSSYAMALDALCGTPQSLDRAALLREELRHAFVASGQAVSPDDWHRLGCVRSWLDVAGAIAHEGFLMPLGAAWQEGATRAWLAMLERHPEERRAADALGVLAVEQPFPKREPEVRAALVAAVARGIAAAAAVRGCAILTHRAGDRLASGQCTVAGLRAGHDSTWQLLHLSRLAASAGDTSLTVTLFDRALREARDAPAWSEVGWHLRWFTEPPEWSAWEGLPDTARAGWVRDRLAARDLRDGHRPGARLVEHWNRLDHVEANFRREPPRHLRGFSQVTANPDGPTDPDRARFTHEPEYVPGSAFRDYLPLVEWLDDRGAVWLRFGKPTKTADWMAVNSTTPLVRESWRYDIDGEPLVLHFESEAFDGAWQATRLVSGILGHYLCALDRNRCVLTLSLACWELPGGCRSPPITRERLEAERVEDRAQIALATTRDDNSVRPDHPVATVAQFARVWDPRSLQPLAVVPYAFRLGDLERAADSTVAIHLAIRQWSAARGEWQEAAFDRTLRLRGRHDDEARLTGYSVVRSASDVSAWALHASQGADRAGRTWGDHLSPLPVGPLQLSDLVLGAASQGESWTTTHGTVVPLGPLGAFNKDEPIALYWQVRSNATLETARITIALHRFDAHGDARPALEVSFEGRVAGGLTEWQRELGVGQLDRGEYRLEVVVEGGGVAARRNGRLLLR